MAQNKIGKKNTPKKKVSGVKGKTRPEYSNYLKKTAAAAEAAKSDAPQVVDLEGEATGMAKSASAGSVTQVPNFWYSPELTTESWLLPKSRQEILNWCRLFYNLEPYVQSIITMHAYYPFSKFDIVCDDPKIEMFYKEQVSNEQFDLFEFMLQASLSYWKFGEAIPFGTMGEDKKEELYGIILFCLSQSLLK